MGLGGSLKFGVTGVARVTSLSKLLFYMTFCLVTPLCAIVKTWCFKRLRCYIFPLCLELVVTE